MVHRLTGVCPTIALHVLWDLPGRREGCSRGAAAGAPNTACSPAPSIRTCFRIRSTNTARWAIPDPAIRARALEHILDSIEIAERLGSRDLSLWFADGPNYPGTQNIRQRRAWFEQGLKEAHARMTASQRMLVEYKPFEPAFYHTDIADWGMALLLAKAAGPQARVLVDTGHHYQGQNIEQIVAWLLIFGHARRLPLQ